VTPGRRPERVRPERALGPVLAAVLTLGAWGAIAHSSGAGWVQALGAVLAGFFVVGMVVPAFAVHRAGCTVVGSPPDTTAGEPVAIEIEVTRPVRLRPLSPPGRPALTGRSPRVRLEVTPPRRGVLTHCEVQVASAAPFGLLWWAKTLTLPLVRPLHVAPRMGEPDPSTVVGRTGSGEDRRRVPARVGEPRGVRPYQSGDLRHWVHWPATAHSGVLMVREMEEPSARPATVEVVLAGDPDTADRQAERAMGTVAGLLSSGRAVTLVTTERDGPVREAVVGVAAAGRRLARAVPTGPLRPPDAAPPPGR